MKIIGALASQLVQLLADGGDFLLAGDDEFFLINARQQIGFGITGDDLTFVNDGDGVAQLFRLFQIVGGENDGGALTVELTHPLP